MIGQKGYPPVHGGIEKHVAELAARLPRRGVELLVYSRPHYSQADGASDLPGVQIKKLPSIATKHFDAISHTFCATTDVLWRQIDVVHYHALGPGLMAGLPRWLARKRTVVTVHGLDWQRDKWGGFASQVLKLGERGSVYLPDRTVVVSQALQDYYRDRYGRETIYIPNGIAPPVMREPQLIRTRGLPENYILFVGRLVPEKGCHHLLAAYGALPETLRRRFGLVIAGGAGFTPGYVDKLYKAAPDGVSFLGYVHGEILDELYTNAALVVLPSTLEGLSITLLEGMSYRRCCLVSDIPPNLEAAGQWGATFASGDVAALGGELVRLLDDPAERERLGAGGQQWVMEHYSWESVADQTSELYHELIGRAQE